MYWHFRSVLEEREGEGKRRENGKGGVRGREGEGEEERGKGKGERGGIYIQEERARVERREGYM